jgi:hypothetical protein
MYFPDISNSEYNRNPMDKKKTMKRFFFGKNYLLLLFIMNFNHSEAVSKKIIIN